MRTFRNWLLVFIAVVLLSPQWVNAQVGVLRAARALLADGVATVPAYSFANDTNLGLWRIGADELGVAGNAAFRGPRPWVDVRAYGAKGDGATDDTTAFTNALAALATIPAPASMDVLTLFVPSGAYRISSTLTVPAGKSIRIIGAGMRASVLDWRGANSGTMLAVNATTTTSGFGLEEIQFANSIAATGVIAVRLGPTAGNGALLHTKIHRVLFRDLATGIRIFDETDEIVISESWFFGLTDGIVAIPAGTTSISNLLVIRNQFQGVTNFAIDAVLGSSHAYLHNTIQGVTASMKGIRADKFDGLVVLGNYFEGPASATAGPFLTLGVTAIGTSSMSGAVVMGNHIDMAGAAGQLGIKVDFVDGTVLGGNTFTNITTAIQTTANATKTSILPQVWGTSVTVKWSELGSERQTTVLDSTLGLRMPGLLGVHLDNSGTITDQGIYQAATNWTSGTITRLNLMRALQPTGAGTITNMTLFQANAAVGTHKMIDGATTKTTPGGVNAWVKVNIDGTIFFIPAYLSKTN